MARIKGGLNAKKKHNRVLKLAKGYRGARSKQYRVAKQSVMRALATAYAGRKQRKRQMRQLWIARINAAARMNGLSYSKFMHGLKLANIDMNRKMLAEMAVNDAEGFATLAQAAKEKLAYELTELVHGKQEADAALEAARNIFSGSGRSENMPTTELTDEDFTDGSISLAAILVRCGLCPSNSDAKRNIKQGGISVNDEKITDFAKSYSKADIGGEFIIKKGKKDYHKVTVK